MVPLESTQSRFNPADKQNQQEEEKDRRSLKISKKKSRLQKASQLLLALRKPEYAAASSHCSIPGLKTEPFKLETL